MKYKNLFTFVKNYILYYYDGDSGMMENLNDYLNAFEFRLQYDDEARKTIEGMAGWILWAREHDVYVGQVVADLIHDLCETVRDEIGFSPRTESYKEFAVNIPETIPIPDDFKLSRVN